MRDFMTNEKQKEYGIRIEPGFPHEGCQQLTCTCGADLKDIKEEIYVSSTGYESRSDRKLQMALIKCVKGDEVTFFV